MLVFSFGIFLFISIFLFQPYTVNGSSMEPTFIGADPYNSKKVGDTVLVLKINQKTEPGDIVVVDSRTASKRTLKDELVEHPIINLFTEDIDSMDHNWIKRVIGIEGNTIELKEGKLYRNGNLLKEDYIFEAMSGSFERVTVPENHIFVLGDNRNHSGDSRMIGSVPNENVIGKVIVRYYPFHRVSKYW